jgi:hypothetical protein
MSSCDIHPAQRRRDAEKDRREEQLDRLPPHKSDDRARKRKKRVDHKDAGNLLSVLEILGQHITTLTNISRSHNQRVPETELVAILDAPCLLKDDIGQVQRLPGR